MSTRRDFLGFLGNVCFVGGITTKEGISRPMLALPHWVKPVLTQEPAVPSVIRHPLLTAAGDHAKAMMQIRAGMTDDRFLDFLEGGLRSARFYSGRDEATMERRVAAAVMITVA